MNLDQQSVITIEPTTLEYPSQRDAEYHRRNEEEMGYLKSTATSLSNMAIAQAQMNQSIHNMLTAQIQAHRGPNKLALREINPSAHAL